MGKHVKLARIFENAYGKKKKIHHHQQKLIEFTTLTELQDQ